MTDPEHDDLDDISEEELALAAELAQRVDDSVGGAKRSAASRSTSTRDSTERNIGLLVTQTALLKAQDQFEPKEQSLREGREEVLRFATKHARKGAASDASTFWWSRIWIWAPLPAAALLALAYGMSDAGQPAGEATGVASQQEDEQDAEQPARLVRAPRASNAPAEVLRAQATYLAAKAGGGEYAEAEARLEEQMRGYRAELLARLDR
jgi:hypothetical protein